MGDPWRGRVIDQRYRVGERLAAGGMGVVYLGEHLGLGKPVAIKVLPAAALMVSARRQRFAREASAMSRLTHPNLVSVIDAGTIDDAPFLVMEFHPGVSLRRVLRGGRLAAGRAAFIARQILAGLASAHESGVVHRDLNPGNVLLVGRPGEDLVKILDFGVAKLLDDGGARSDLSAVAAHLPGTPEYMSPEQAQGLAIDPRTDLYALAVILYEMVTGRRPFEAEERLAVLRQHVEDPPPSPVALAPDLSTALVAFVMRGLAKDRELRWPSAVDASAALAATPEGRLAPPFDPPAAVGGAPRPGRAPRRARLVLVLLLVLTAVAAGAYASASRGLLDAIGVELPDWASAP